MKRLHTFLRFTLFFSFVLTSEIVTANNDYTFKISTNVYLHIDSLMNLLNDQPLTEEMKMEIYFHLANNYSGLQVDSSLYYSTKGIPIAEKLKEYEILMNFHTHIAAAHSFRNNFDSALIHCDMLKQLAAKRNDKKWEAIALAYYAEVYRKQEKYNTAIDYYLKALKICEDEGLIETSLAVLIYLSEINRRLGNTETALMYVKKAEIEYNKTDKLEALDWRLTSILNEYAFIYLDFNDLDSALYYALKSDSINQDRFVENVCHTKGLLATIYLQQNKYDFAFQYAWESYIWADTLQDRNLYAYSAKILSDVYMVQKRYLEAETTALKVWMTDSTHMNESRAIAANIALANIYMNNTERAAYFFKKYEELNVLYNDKSFHSTMSDMEVKYETDKKETRIAMLEKEKQLYVWLEISSVLLACSLGIIMFQSIKNERKKRQFVAKESLQQGEIKERLRIAEELHDRLGGSLSAVKIGLQNEVNPQHSSNKIDECIKEVREITNNIMPRTLRLFGIKAALEEFSVEFSNVNFYFFGEDKRINFNLEFVIYCCAKELMNNALKHSNAEHINIQLLQTEKHLLLTVQDDGCGFDEKNVVWGDGLQNIRNRVISFKGKLDIFSSPGKGTETILELKIES